MTKNTTLIKALGTLCLMLYMLNGAGQTFKDTTNRKDRTGANIGVSYLSNNVFYGRTDTVKTPTIIPLIKYTFGPGIYVSADLDYIANRAKNKLDGGSLALGYNFDVGNNAEGGISFTKYFYNAGSTQVSSANRANINANFSYDLAGIITPYIYLDHSINRKGVGNDTFINFGISHDFELDGLLGDDDELTISPSVDINAGTQNFYDDYVVTRATRTKGATALQSTLLAAEKAQLSKFSLLDYELSLPVVYQMGHVSVNFKPTVAFAQNKLPATISSALSRSGQLFYIEAGISLAF